MPYHKEAFLILKHYFLRPIQLCGVGFLGKRVADRGLKFGLFLMSTAGKQIFNGMNESQLLRYADFIEDSFYLANR